MDLNKLPIYDQSDNPTGCCPRFNPDGWDNQELHFKDKLFVKAVTRSLFHIPLNMGRVFAKTSEAIEQADGWDRKQLVVLTHDLSPWKSEHYFAVTREIPGQQMAELNGDYLTKVFEGPYRDAPKWYEQMKSYIRGQGKETISVYFFYTTCPKCAAYYGKNYVVAFGKAA